MKQKHIILALLFGITSASMPASAETFDEFGNSYGDKAPAKKAASATKDSDLRFAESPYKACADVTFISKSDYKKDEEFWKEAVACGADIQVLPESDFLSGILRSLKSQTGFSGDKVANEKFLRTVGAKAGEYLDYNIAVNGAIAACARDDKDALAKAMAGAKSDNEKKLFDAANCKGTMDEVKDVAEEYGPKARVQYALTKKLQSVFGTMGDYVNLTADAFGASMRTEMDKASLSAKEQKEVDAKFAEIQARMKVKFDKEMAAHEKLQDSVKGLGGEDAAIDGFPMALQSRLRGEESEIVAKELVATLQKAPMLAYAAKPGRLSNEDLARAMGEVVKNATSQRKKISDAMSAAEGTKGANERAKKMMEFMAFTPVVEDVLKEDPSMCGNATKIANAIQGNSNKHMVAGIGATVGLAVATAGVGSAIGAGAFAAGAASSAVALGASTAMIYKPDYDKMTNARERAHAAAFTEDGKATSSKSVGDMKEYEEARDAVTMNFASLPLDFIGLGIYKGAANAGKAAVLGAKDLGALAKLRFLEQPAAKLAAKNALTKGGLSELQALKVLTDLKSTDGVVAGRALTQLAKVLDVDSSEVKVMQNLFRTGIVPEVDTRASSRALARLRAIPAEQRAGTLTRVEDSLSNLNTAKINAANRDQAMETIIAGNQFGADPKRIASVVTDWDSGLDGLARTYDVARKKMDLPEVRGLASVEAKQEAAFGKALDELMEANPEFKALKSEEKLAAKTQMMGCGLKGK